MVRMEVKKKRKSQRLLGTHEMTSLLGLRVDCFISQGGSSSLRVNEVVSLSKFVSGAPDWTEAD
jgi:hypothetical protein